MKYIQPKKLKVLTAMFFGTGIWGIIAGLFLITPMVLIIVVFGVINLCLGGLCGYKLLTQVEPESNKRKK